MINNCLERHFSKGDIPEYMKRMIIERGNEIFIPVSFIQSERGDIAVYDVSGYVPLPEIIRELNAGEIFKYIELLLLALIKAGEYLILPERFHIKAETLFIRENKKSLRIFFIPQAAEETEKHRLKSQLTQLIEQVMELGCTGSVRSYLIEFLKYVEKNCNIYDLLNFVSDAKREIYLIGIR